MADFLPRPDLDFLRWTTAFDHEIYPAPQAVGLTPAQAEAFRAGREAYESALHVALNPCTRTRPTIEAKARARAALTDLARQLAGLVQRTPGITEAQRVTLGLKPKPIGRVARLPRPTTAPTVYAEPIIGRQAVRVRLLNPDAPSRLAKPAGVAGAVLFRFVGPNEPTASADWERAGMTSRTAAEVPFPPEVPPGSVVWVTACWFNPTSQCGPAGNAAPTRLAGGSVSPMLG